MNGNALKRSRGVGLIEVLVTMLILSTALLTLTTLQTRALQYNQGAYFRSQANIYGYDILDRMRINVGMNKVALSGYNFTTGTCTTASDTSTQTKKDLTQWRIDVGAALPASQCGISCDATTRVCTITITWNELNSSGQAAENTSSFNYTAKL